MVEITEQNFYHEFRAYHGRDGGGKGIPSKSFVMIRPDRPFDQAAHRYADDVARRNGNAAMKAWFEYLAAKKFIKTFNAWREILKSGKSIMVVSADPTMFDMTYVPLSSPALPLDFWDEFEQSRIPIDRRYESVEDRARLAKIAKDCAYELRMNAARQPPSPSIRPLREWNSTPLKDIDASKPLPKLSEELRAKLGCGTREVAAE